MAYYNTTTATVSKNVRITWICSKCGRVALAIEKIEADGQDRFNGSGRHGRQENSNKRAGRVAQRNLLFAMSHIESDPIDSNLKSRCPHCNHKEIWAKSVGRFRKYLVTPAKISIPMGLFSLFYVGFVEHDWVTAITVFLVCMIPFFIVMGTLCIDSRLKKRCNQLPKESWPKLVDYDSKELFDDYMRSGIGIDLPFWG